MNSSWGRRRRCCSCLGLMNKHELCLVMASSGENSWHVLSEGGSSLIPDDTFYKNLWLPAEQAAVRRREQPKKHGNEDAAAANLHASEDAGWLGKLPLYGQTAFLRRSLSGFPRRWFEHAGSERCTEGERELERRGGEEERVPRWNRLYTWGQTNVWHFWGFFLNSVSVSLGTSTVCVTRTDFH